MAISTFKIYLMHKASSESNYSVLVPIKEFPNLGGAPEMLETTTLSDPAQTYIMGIQTVEALEFVANYTKTDFAKLKALEGSDEQYAVWFGATDNTGETPDGTDGKFTFTGELAVYVNGGGVNEVVNMTITIAPTSVITHA